MKEIRLLTDGRATKEAILQRLSWLVKGIGPGDRILFFYAGHGAQVASRHSQTDEVDGLDEVICPVDFDWTERTTIRDKDFQGLFGLIPANVEAIWISDSCHSGDLSRGLLGASALEEQSAARSVRPSLGRFLRPPVDIEWRTRAGLVSGVEARRIMTASDSTVTLLSACRSDQTAADAKINGRSNGAFTRALLDTLLAPGWLGEPLSEVVPQVSKCLLERGYAQTPGIEGAEYASHRPFMLA